MLDVALQAERKFHAIEPTSALILAEPTQQSIPTITQSRLPTPHTPHPTPHTLHPTPITPAIDEPFSRLASQ
ncbi:MAG: hypothetical protein KME27_28250 [Lyngbya sp. HA4199-MV5]|nr:hypothetical protein [Lyngbya sp. HA4199-MV5]